MNEIPERFVELVRDGLLHLYDLAFLQTHPLTLASDAGSDGEVARGRLVRSALLDAIEAFRPRTTVAVTSRGWRTYRILELRYIEGYEVTSILDLVSLSRSQYHREHHAALLAVASLLWEQWQLPTRWPSVVQSLSSHAPGVEPIRSEARRLVSDRDTAMIDPGETIREVSQLLKMLCGRHDVRLDLELGPLPLIQGDRVALRHALLTILTRAVPLCEHGTLQLQSAYTVGWLQLNFTGQGGADPFVPDALGIGDSRPFIESLNGYITCPSLSTAPGRWGISLTFPISERPTLLVVDNNPDFVQLIGRYLSDQPWEVVGVSDVELAYDLAQHRHPRAILLDIVIPGRDGWDLLLDLKQNPLTASIPVIVCSVLDQPEMATTLGAATYLQKPVDRNSLRQVLATVAVDREHQSAPRSSPAAPRSDSPSSG